MFDDETRQGFVEFINRMHFENIEIEIPGDVAEVYINNLPHNYLTETVLNELMLAYQLLALSEKSNKFRTRGIIISGRGRRTFSAGASLDMLGQLKKKKDQERIANISKEATDTMADYTVPVIAAINGICLGAGLEIALACHYRVAGKGVYLGFPEIHLGLMPGAGGTQRLPRMIGRSKAQNLILSGKLITAEEALHLGMVDEVVERKEVMAAARSVAEDMCNKDKKATEFVIKAINTSLNDSEKDGFSVERELFWELVNDRIESGEIADNKVGIKIGKKKKKK